MRWLVQVELPGGTWYTLAECVDLLATWAVIESLMGPGSASLSTLKIVRILEADLDN